MAWALTSHTAAGSFGAGGGSVTSSAINTTGADILFVGISVSHIDTAATPPSDSAGNTWVLVKKSYHLDDPIAELFYASATTGTFNTSASHTFSYTSVVGSDFPAIFVQAFSGSGASPIDQTNESGQINDSLTMQSGSVTPSLSGELLVTVAAWDGAQTSAAIDSGFIQTDFVLKDWPNCFSGAMCYLVQSAPAAVNPTWTWTPSAGRSCSLIGTFMGFVAPLKIWLAEPGV